MAPTVITIFVISVNILIQPCGFCPGSRNPAILRVSSQPNTTSGKYLSFIPFFSPPSSYTSQLVLHPALCLDQISLNCSSFPLLLHPSHKLPRRSTHPALHPTSHVIHHPFLMSFLFLSETPLSHLPRLALAAHSPPIRRFTIKPPTLPSESSHPQKASSFRQPIGRKHHIIAPPFSAS